MSTTILVFGITGDLSRRKLLPSLQQVVSTDKYDDLRIVGISRREIDIEHLLYETIGDTTLNSITDMVKMDMSSSEDYLSLKDKLSLSGSDQLLVYFAVPPQATGQIIKMLGESGYGEYNIKLLLEKPFGLDLESAKDMNDKLVAYFDEGQIYRIDHYLAKQMAENIVMFRSQNAIFSYLWSNKYIEKIELFAFEKIGVEGRSLFYEQTGALRDFLQGHLMQLLALTIMDTDDGFDEDNVSTKRLEALNSIKIANPQYASRAQYDGYRDEVELPASCTETFVNVELESDDDRWKGVPFILATGKSLDNKSTQVRVHFKKLKDSQTNCLTFNVQPHEGVDIELNIGTADYEHTHETKHLAFRYPEDIRLPDAYELVLVDAIKTNKNIFPSNDEIIRSWEVLQPVLDDWSMSDDGIAIYNKNSSYEEIMKCIDSFDTTSS